MSDPRRAAEADFDRLGMAATAERNGVLILVAPESQSLRRGRRPRDRREAVRRASGTRSAASPRDEFRAVRFTDGIVTAVHARRRRARPPLPAPPGEEDRNELPDGVSRG